MSITLSTKSSPFPYAAIAIATYTQKAELIYDESVDGVTLDLEGSQLSAEDEIVADLAKAGGLAGDSAKAFMIFDITRPKLTGLSLADCSIFRSREVLARVERSPRYPCCSRFVRQSSRIPHFPCRPRYYCSRFHRMGIT